MNIVTSELEHLREEVKNCHRIIKDLQKKREFVGLTDEECHEIVLFAESGDWHDFEVINATEAKLKDKNS